MARVLPPPTSTQQKQHTRTTSTEKKEIWPSLLRSVANARSIPSKRLLLLGGSPSSQSELVQQVLPSPGNGGVLANRFALGYGVRDIRADSDGEILARVGVWTLDRAEGEYVPLMRRAIGDGDGIVVILLDWSRPWGFVAELRRWIALLRRATDGLDQRDVLDENDGRWKRWRDDASPEADGDAVSVPLGPGEYDEPLGLPLVVVCQNTHEVEKLEKEQGYKEKDFDFVLQFLRTVLLKHGAGLVYTMPSQPGQMRQLLHCLLQVGEGMGERAGPTSRDAGLKHNVIDRDRVFVPPGWDSWGKIRVLREGFDIEGVSRAWGVDIDKAMDQEQHKNTDDEQTKQVSTESMYAQRISNPKRTNTAPPAIEVEYTSDQTFLAAQLERLEAFLAEDEAKKKDEQQRGTSATTRRQLDDGVVRPSMNDQIGPVQFNMGGIQYDADEALRRIKERTKAAAAPAQGTPDRPRSTRESTPFTPGSPPTFEPGKDIPVENLEAYFASLIKGGRSAANSPRAAMGSPRVGSARGSQEPGKDGR
ncbi:hypothetical protein ANO11243_006930 [Dothideomycetidae sp. 11243]|nr:hypothetical protein ANO11243_006930 [fungal sp. No.11243]